MTAPKVTHLLAGLEIGGLQRAVVRLASRGIREGQDHSLVLFDTPFRSAKLDLDPGSLRTHFIKRRPGIDFRFARYLSKHLTRFEVDILHAHNDTAVFYGALALYIGRTQSIALIGRFGTRPSHATTGARFLTRWASGKVDEMIAVSQELTDWLVHAGWVDRCSTTWNGVDLAEFHPEGSTNAWRERLRIPNGAILVGHVGRFDSIKRHEDLFEAAETLRAADPPVFFAFAGDGPLLERFRVRAARLGNVLLLSNITDVAAFLRSIDIFVLCSEHEGTPQALLEALACGRPVIATAVGGVPHVLRAESALPVGCLIPPGKPLLLSAEILNLARDPRQRSYFGRLARQRAEDFSFEREWAIYSGVYSRAQSKVRARG